MGDATIHLFVYGTLKQGYANNQRLAEATCLGKAISVDSNYLMQDVGFPVLWDKSTPQMPPYDTPAKGGPDPGQVSGEIYVVTPRQLASCDYLEGNGRMYTRQERRFKIGKTEVKAWVYLWNLDRTHDWIEPVNGILTWDRGGRRKSRMA